MIPSKIKNQADSDYSTISETFAESSSLCYQNQEIRNKGATGPRRKVKKLAMKLTRLPSLKLTTRQARNQFDCLSMLSSDAASSLQPAQLEMSDASPNYMRTTTSSDAKKDSLQKSARTLTRRSSFKSQKSLTRLSSAKFRRSLMRKSSGGSDLKKKLKKSRSIKLGNQSSTVLSNDEYTWKPMSDAKNAHSQASSCYSEPSLSSNDKSKRSSSNLRPNFASGNKVITRTSSLRPLRILTKTASLRTRRSSMKKSSQMLDSSIHTATCSSALKESKFPDHLELQPGGSESEGISTMKVCPYSYCSLHGHRHAALPPLKRFVSMRRRMLKTQKSIKLESQSFQRRNHSSNSRKGMRTSKIACDGDAAVLDTAHKSRAVTSSRKIARPKAGLNGEGIHFHSDEDTSNSKSVAEIMPSEPSHPHLCLKKSLQLRNFPTAERSAVLRVTSKEHHTDKKEEGVIASNSHKHVLTVDHPENIDSEFTISEANTSTGVADKPFDKSRSLNPNIFVESRAINNMASSAFMCELQEEQTASNEEKNEDSMQDYQLAMIDSAPNYSATIGKTQMEKPKNMGLWNLIYQHMVSGIAAEGETQPSLNKMDEEEQEEDANNLPGMNKSGAYSDFSGIEHSMGVDDHDRGSHKILFYQQNAIKLVQAAFDKILSEIPDQSSDDQSINSDSTTERELAEKNHDEGGGLNISTSFDSGKDSMVTDLEEMRLKADNRNGSEGEKAEPMGNKSNQQTPKSWSNLKKIIILKRFVKALEKVRNFNPRKPQYLPVQPEPEAEKIHLRHQTTEERKNSEAWMLDYALQQVISTLAPAQKRKVALLVQAFETVVPLPETETSLSLNIAASSQATPVDCSSSSYQNGFGNGEETKFGISLHKTSFPDRSSKEDRDQVNNSCPKEEHIPESCSEINELPESCSEINELSSESDSTCSAASNLASETTTTGLKENLRAINPTNGDHNSMIKNELDSINHCLVELGQQNLCDKPFPKSADVASTSHDEGLLNGEVLQDVTKEVSLHSASEVHDHDFGFNSHKLAANCQINATGEQSDEPSSQIPKNLAGSIVNCNVVSSVSVSETREESSKGTEAETMLRNKFLQAFSQHEESKSSSTEVAHENQLEKQRNMRLWFLIYKHMVSGSAKLLDEGADKEDQGSDANTSSEMNNASHQGFSVTDHDMDMENHAAGNQKIELQQIEAIRMVQEAIDEIPLPDNQDDSPDDQSVTSDIIPDQEHLEKQPGEGGQFFISTSNGRTKNSYEESNSKKVEHSSTMDPKEPCLDSDGSATAEKEKTVFKEGNKPKLPAQKSWGNLKKLILLKRFVKALEKVKPFNPREPRFLPLDPEKEAEKVQLRHQDMEDRKNADEWMLDYALQNVVAKLTPARKRKVQLLVEAFETVIPTIGS